MFDTTDSNKLKVLLYSDGTEHSFSAAVYAANLFYSIPNMQVTVLYVQEGVNGFREENQNLMEPRLPNPNSDWVKHLMGEADSDEIRQYSEIIVKTKDIFSERGYRVDQEIIYSNPSAFETVKAILSYASKNAFELIIMGTRGLTSLNGLIYGSLAHGVLNKSMIPVLLIKKLPQEFIDRYCSAADGGIDMTDFKFKALLYSDGSHQAFSAAVYAATLLKNMPNMHLTILQVHRRDEVSIGTEYNWVDTWPVSPTSEWMKHVLDKYDLQTRNDYIGILNKTNEIFFNRGFNVTHQNLYSNTDISDISDTSDIEDVVLDYATQNSFDLIIMGTRGLSSLKGLIFGSFAHNVLNKSTLPVMLIKKLPQDFIDRYLLDN